MATYVCSDLHGLKNRYDRMIQQIKQEDTLYILGDVIDRGPHGIKILWDVMHRDNVIMLLGNHELMMKEYYEVMLHPQQSVLERDVIINRWTRNHCEPTIAEFEAMDKASQREILNYLSSLIVAVCDLRVHQECFYLTHAYPQRTVKEGIIYQKTVKTYGLELRDFVWERFQKPMEFFNDRTVIVGHTPTMYVQSCLPYEIWTAGKPLDETRLINIDCGCALNNEATRMGLLRLDDRKVFYF